MNGTFTYRIDGAEYTDDTLKTYLAGLEEGAVVNVSFVFFASDNYTGGRTGSFKVTIVVDIEFQVDDEAASQANGIEIDEDKLVYGYKWSEIVSILSEDITASVNGTGVDGAYTLSAPDTVPAVGSASVQVLFSSLDGKYVNIPVFTIEVNIAKAAVEVPTAASGLDYTGEEQTGVADGDLYSVAGGTATNAGNYTAVLTLDDVDNYRWTDESFTGTIAWSIAKAAVKVPTAEPDDGEALFTDVSGSDFFFAAVKWAVEKGITFGTSDTTFSPDASCTRAQMVTFLWRAAGCEEIKAISLQLPFGDIDQEGYYYEALLWAVENGITNGTSATTFSPDASCTRAQMVTFLHRYLAE